MCWIVACGWVTKACACIWVHGCVTDADGTKKEHANLPPDVESICNWDIYMYIYIYSFVCVCTDIIRMNSLFLAFSLYIYIYTHRCTHSYTNVINNIHSILHMSLNFLQSPFLVYSGNCDCLRLFECHVCGPVVFNRSPKFTFFTWKFWPSKNDKRTGTERIWWRGKVQNISRYRWKSL